VDNAPIGINLTKFNFVRFVNIWACFHWWKQAQIGFFNIYASPWGSAYQRGK